MNPDLSQTSSIAVAVHDFWERKCFYHPDCSLMSLERKVKKVPTRSRSWPPNCRSKLFAGSERSVGVFLRMFFSHSGRDVCFAAQKGIRFPSVCYTLSQCPRSWLHRPTPKPPANKKNGLVADFRVRSALAAGLEQSVATHRMKSGFISWSRSAGSTCLSMRLFTESGSSPATMTSNCSTPAIVSPLSVATANAASVRSVSVPLTFSLVSCQSFESLL